MPTNNEIRFLDIRFKFLENHVCWSYSPRANKPLIPYTSAHSKLVKRGIINLCLNNALEKSCPHLISESLHEQIARFHEAGYPADICVSVAERILKKKRQESLLPSGPSERKEKIAVIPYMHCLSHDLKKIGTKANVRVVFSAPDKLIALSKKTLPADERPQKMQCTIKHREKFVKCTEGIVYDIPLSCGKRYVGQSGRCLNERLREHNNNLRTLTGSNLALHCKECGCVPYLDKCSIFARHRDQLTREVIEAARIAALQDKCVSKPSISLSKRELAFLKIN
ncbi:uncharacterized protein LOC144124980 [Amblyomma americanum]